MTREELITLGEHKVRSNEHLMLSYLNEFEALFGRKPNVPDARLSQIGKDLYRANKHN